MRAAVFSTVILMAIIIHTLLIFAIFSIHAWYGMIFLFVELWVLLFYVVKKTNQ
jgi:hypothetical protein